MAKTRKKLKSGDGGASSSGSGTARSPDPGLAELARLVSDLMHEFRTPLGSIVGAASALDDYADDIDPATRAKLCGGIVNEAQGLEQLLTGLAVISRARTGRLLRDKGKVELNDLLNGLSSKARHRYDRPIRMLLQPGEILLTTDAAALRTLVFTMLNLAGRLAPEDETLELSLSEDDGAAELRLTSGTGESGASKLGPLLEGSLSTEILKSRMSACAVFLAAIHEVVHILGGELSIWHDEGMSRLHQTVRLPIESG